MSGFLYSAACKGRRPKHLKDQSLVSRPDLIARLLCDRGVARFIVAPTGFGKTLLAAEYAEVVFSFRHTFWVNAASPCFLRDLDAGGMAQAIGKADEQPSLVVFDDIPRMDLARADAFSTVVDELLSAGNEVVVTCVPACDAYAERHRDRLKLSARQMLLSDAEAASAPRAPEKPSAGGRIACVAWGEDDGSAVLRGVAADEPSASMLLAMFLVLAIGDGTPADIRPYLAEGAAREAFSRAEEDYPFLGVNARETSFTAASIDAALLAAAFFRKLDAMAARSTCDTANGFVIRLANDLLARGLGNRACAIMRVLAKKESCALWLAEHGADLSRGGCFKAAHELFTFVDKRHGSCRLTLIADEAVRLAILDDARSAVFLAESIAFARAAAPEMRVRMLGLAAFAGDGEPNPRREAALRDLLRGGRQHKGGHGVDVADAPASAFGGDAALALALASDPEALAGMCERLAREGRRDEGACICALLAVTQLAKAATAGPAGMRFTGIDASGAELIGGWACDIACSADGVDARETAIAAGARDAVSGGGGSPASPVWLSLRIASALSRAVDAGALPQRCLPPESVLSRAHRVEVALFAERAAYRRDVIREERAAAARDATTRNRYAAQSPVRREAAAAHVPMLYVGLFGGLDVRIGGVPVDAAKFSRQKTKTLLALLVLNRGRELSRSRLLEMLWPHMTREAAQKSFYTVWSQLRRALEFEGSCPYLLRDQGGVRLDAHLLECDVADFDAMCRSLSFGRIDVEGWQAHLAAVGDEFAQELLPSETDNDYIASMRRRFRSDLVDALVAASARLSEAGEPRAALWFAREAVRRDGGREDAYAALMQAQIDAGQRAAAIDTYFTCRRYLADELGIDPSTALVRLYRSVIESVEELG